MSEEEAAAFVETFARGWCLQKPQAFLEFFGPRLHPEVVATQPMAPVARGRAAMEEMFARFFRLFPDLTLTVTHWGSRGDVLYIESQCRGTLGGRPLEFAVCDRFVLLDGLITERRSYLDSAPLLRAVLLRPRAWPRVLAALLYRKRL